jgi:hypothetical protein
MQRKSTDTCKRTQGSWPDELPTDNRTGSIFPKGQKVGFSTPILRKMLL